MKKRILNQRPICLFSIIFNRRPPKRKWEVNVKFLSLRTEFFVSFLSQNSYFYETASFTLFTVKLSQWIKLSQNDIIAKMFLLSLVSHDYDIICKYVPHTRNEWAINTKDHICIFPKKKKTRKRGILHTLKEM